jgi:Fe-S-cluster containining protein
MTQRTVRELWYHAGLPFQCSGCGNCCTGAPGYVWVGQPEIDTLSAAVGMRVEEFESRYVRRVRARRSLVELANGDCVFFDNAARRCSVYEARPHQCRTWPFWESNVRTPGAWRDVCKACPGSGVGPVVPLEEIRTQMAVVRV